LRPEILKSRNAITDLRPLGPTNVAAEPVRLDRRDVSLRLRQQSVTPVFDAGGNVVSIALKHDADNAPALSLTTIDRPIRALAGRDGRARLAALLAVSMLAHGAIYAAIDQPRPPLTSIGEVAISVEIVLGSEHAAGLAETPTETEAPDSAASTASRQATASNPVGEPRIKKAEEVSQPEPVKEPRKVEPLPPEAKLAAFVETPQAPEPKPPLEEKVEETKPVVEQPKPPTEEKAEDPKPVAEAKPPETKIEEPPVAELAIEQPKSVEEKPAELKTAAIPPRELEPVKPPELVKPPEPVAAVPEKPPEILPPPPPPEQQANPVQQQAAPTPQPERSKEVPNRAATASVASTSSSGIGRGRSDVDSNYRGLVAAHLARHKRFPEEIRRRSQQGSTLITFAIDDSGKVTTIALARSSGHASIDEASQEMIRRASPFPAPPKGQPMSFSVPVSFEIR
jgi:periplasmic protein TonB